MTRRVRASLALLLALCLPVPAYAQEPGETARAATEYDGGVRAFERGDFAEAARAFERADAIEPHPRTRYNAALSWDRAGDMPRAADAYSSALEGPGLDRERVDAARSRLKELTRKIGAIDVRRPEGGKVSVGHVSEAPIPVRIHVAPGAHRLDLVSADGTREQRDVEVVAGERVVLEIAITTAPLAQPAESAPPPKPRQDPAPLRADAGEPSSARTTWGIAVLSGAVAFAAGAVVFGVRTANAIDEFDASGDRDADARERAVRYRALSWAAGGAALACGAIGIVLLAAGDEKRNASAARFELGMRGAGAEARWRF